ncbi:MAG: hypothetical protein HYU41_27905 [Candidatus Rokubacteria bacterium]|nr:hypothetical protein [Candidatus Rokubacteria bacterium]
MKDAGRVGARTPPPMPSGLDELAGSVLLPRELVEQLRSLVTASEVPFSDLVDLTLERLGGVIPPWPLLDAWNRWCFERRLDFFVWHPGAQAPSDRQRLEVLVHTLVALAVKERSAATYARSRVSDAEVVMAGDDCPICSEHRHHVVSATGTAADALPPFHPGCRCRLVPHLV